MTPLILKDFEIRVKETGSKFSGSDSKTQAELLNSFCGALIKRMDDKSLYGQLYSISKFLDHKSRKVLSKLLQFPEE